MPDRRRHRGAHPDDALIFAPQVEPILRRAVDELGWLLSRDYSRRAALALVGDRYGLTTRQREAVRRSTCSDAQLERRRARAVDPAKLRGCTLWIDGFNVLTTIESSLGGGVLLMARDGALRDMASMHGSYRMVLETAQALEALGRTLDSVGVTHARWWLDSPVSNSGRLAARLRDHAAERALLWEVTVVRDPDDVLGRAPDDVIVASADSEIMQSAPRTWQLASATVAGLGEPAWLIDLTPCAVPGPQSFAPHAKESA